MSDALHGIPIIVENGFIKCWIIWEHFIKPNGNVRFLRAIDLSEEKKDLHLLALQQEPNHGRFEVETNLLEHAMGHDIKLVMGNVYK